MRREKAGSGQVKHLGRGGEAAQLGGGDEGTQVGEARGTGRRGGSGGGFLMLHELQ